MCGQLPCPSNDIKFRLRFVFQRSSNALFKSRREQKLSFISMKFCREISYDLFFGPLIRVLGGIKFEKAYSIGDFD
jgi:hypothetical protein